MRRYRGVFWPQTSSVVCQGNLSPVRSLWADLTILGHGLLENSTRWGVSGQNCVIQLSARSLCSAKGPWRVPPQKISPFMNREGFLWWTSGKINLTANLYVICLWTSPKVTVKFQLEKLGRCSHPLQTQVDSWTVTRLCRTSYSQLLWEAKAICQSSQTKLLLSLAARELKSDQFY